ncbi:MAG: hypothetical protein KJ072_28340 [Verrucomicrobia bacterium]|nr:hypothetical protein [Verrucomicrobiota bacterium]
MQTLSKWLAKPKLEYRPGFVLADYAAAAFALRLGAPQPDGKGGYAPSEGWWSRGESNPCLAKP